MRRRLGPGDMIAGRRAVPPLQACVAGDQVTVYPAATACAQLHRAPFAGYSGQQTMAITVNARLADYQNQHSCSTASTLAAVARNQLNRTGLGGWTITDTTGTGHCAQANLLPDSQQVLIAPAGS